MAKSTRSRQGGGSNRKWWVLLAILAVLAVVFFLNRVAIFGYTGIATAYSARIACSCHYIAGRDLDSCETDKLAGMELVTLVADDARKSVTARFPLLSSSTAYHREGYGCVLEEWDD